MSVRRSAISLALALCASTAVAVGVAQAGAGGDNWRSAGGNRANTRFQETEHQISPATVGSLDVAWVLPTSGDVSATPAVEGDTVFVPDWAGNLYAIDRATGAPRWITSIPDVTGLPGDKARATPAVSDDLVVVGNQGPFGGGGRVMAFDRATGVPRWSTQVDAHPAAIITQSATIHDGVVYVGVASQEEAYSALIPGYVCCTFRGSMAALDLATGAILWKTYMAPDGYSGNAVWGSSPAIDVKRGSVYVATGNNYSVPDDVLSCVEAAGDDADAKAACLPADDFFDAIVSLDMATGAVKWVTRALPYDAWTVDCLPFFGDGDNCPDPAGPDYDFGQAPALYRTKINGKPIDVVGAGQKSGQYWALNANTGQVIWVSEAGPGGTAGGLQWGSAVDNSRVYTANANSNQVPWSLTDGSVTTQGVWTALDRATGQVRWQVTPSGGGSTSGPVTTANGVVFGCSLDPDGHMYALDASTGAELWRFASGGSCLSGAAISDGSVYWGSGYSNFGFGTANNKLYAFSLPD
jgi:polyvinyl alcohol dehydrogenase (cytochrome)